MTRLGCVLTAALLASTGAGVSGFVGGGKDKHGCRASAGYQWCATLAKCIRPFTTKCPTSAPKYQKITSKYRECHPIRTIRECQQAATVLHLRDRTATNDRQNGVRYDPPYCYYEGGHLKFNAKGTNKGSCSRYDVCLCGRKGQSGSSNANWVLLFRQTVPMYMPAKKWANVNSGNPRNPNYSILSTLDNKYRGADGTFTFKINWPRKGGATHYNIWKQTSNPMLDKKVHGYKPVEIHYKQNHWGGLEHSGTSLLDGSVNHGNWFYAIGSKGPWGGGIPGAYSAEKVTELYVKKGHPLPPCANGEVGVANAALRAAKANVPMIPEVYYNGGWFPVCGHYFWDNNNGATTICKQLGFATGKRVYTRAKLDNDAMPVGKCAKGQKINKCNQGGNAFGNVNYRNGWCKEGKNIGVKISCSGGAPSAYRTRSCVGGATRAPTNKQGGAMNKAVGISTIVKKIKDGGVPGHTTYQLLVDTSRCKKCKNIYAVAGETLHSQSLTMPPAWNIENTRESMHQMGSNIGPANKALYHIQPLLQYDSYLTIGDSPAKGAITSLNLDNPFANWTDGTGINVQNGAIFFSNPSHGPITMQTVVAQLTIRTGRPFSAAALVNGKETHGMGWSNYLTWAYRPKNAGTGVRTKIKQMGWSNAADSGHGMHGMDTFQLIVDTSACAKCKNIYAMAGNKHKYGSMVMPPAWQFRSAQFGTDLGPPNPVFYKIQPQLKFDSWITIGIGGVWSQRPTLSDTGLKLSSWDNSHGLSVDDGLIFFMKPADGPQTRQTVVAQITVPTGKPWKAQALFQGQTRAREGVWDDFLTWNYTPEPASSGH